MAVVRTLITDKNLINMLINKIEKKQNGFSLIELLAVVFIAGTLIS